MAPMSDLEPRVSRLEQARKDLEDAMIVMAHLEKKAGERIEEHAIFLAEHEKTMREHDRQIAEQREFGKQLDQRIDRLVSAIGKSISEGRPTL
jgi:uncharacterized coiled-coil protein SlyX